MIHIMQFGAFGRRALVAWVGFVRSRAWPVLLLAVAFSALSLHYAITTIGINTSTTDMLSAELPFRKNAEALKQAFPQFTDSLTVVVEAGSPEAASDAAEQLSARLRSETDLFRDVFFPEGDRFFRRNGLLYLSTEELYSLSDRLAGAQPLLGALSGDLTLRGLAGVLVPALTEGDTASADLAGTLGPVLERMTVAIESVEAGRPEPLSWRAVVSGEVESSEPTTRQFVTVQPVPDFSSLTPVAEALSAIDKIVVGLGLTADRGFRVRVTGGSAMLQDELVSLRDGMGLVGILSLTLVIGLLAIGLRSVRLLLGTVSTLLMGLIWTAGFATLVIGELNLISVAFAVLFIGLSVDFGIHFSLRYREALGRAAQHEELGRAAQQNELGRAAQDEAGSGTAGRTRAALHQAAEGVGTALLLSAIAAAIGFFSFLPTDYRGVSELGLISGAGMFIALFANLTVLPAILTILPLAPEAGHKRWSLGDRLQAMVRRRFRLILLTACGLGVAAGLTVPLARFDDDPLNLRDLESESVATLIDLLDDPRVQPYDAEFLAADLAAAQEIAARLASLPEVESVRTIADLVPKDQDEKLAVIEDMSFFLGPLFGPQAGLAPPDAAARRQALAQLGHALDAAPATLAGAATRLAAALARLRSSDAPLAEVEEVLLGRLPDALGRLGDALGADTVELGDLPASLRDRRLAADGRATVQIIPREDLRDQQARRRFVDAVRRQVPGLTGAPVTITEAGRAVVGAFREAAVYGVVLIVLLLLLVLRSARDTAMVLAPLGLATLLTVGFTVVFEQPFNFANVIVLPLLLGLGVASGIHIVVRSRLDGDRDILETSTPRAVMFSALTTIGSFGALALSSHRGTASMGLLLTIAIGLTLTCTLIVLPALLETARRRTPGGKQT